MTELSPAKIELLKSAVDIQERMLDGCALIFKGLRMSTDPEVAPHCDEAIAAINQSREILYAMIDKLDVTLH